MTEPKIGTPAILAAALLLLASAGLAPAQDSGQSASKVQRPEVLKQIDPEYTREARDAGLEGTVLLTIVVNKYGTPSRVTVKKGIVEPPRDDLGLNESAVESVRKWRFRPGTKDGQPVAVLATVEVNFRLK